MNTSFLVFQESHSNKTDQQFVLEAQILYGQSLDCQKSRLAWILFLTCSFSLFSDVVMQVCAIPYFVFLFLDRTQGSMFRHL